MVATVEDDVGHSRKKKHLAEERKMFTVVDWWSWQRVVVLMAQGGVDEEMVTVLVSCVGGRKKKKQKKKIYSEEREDLVVVVSLSVRFWVCGEVRQPSVGGGKRFMWGLQRLKPRWREKRRRNVQKLEKLVFWLNLD